MANPLLYLDQLKPLEALQILSEAATQGPGEVLDEVRILFPPNGLGNFISLEIPNLPPQSRRDPTRARMFDAMIEAYREQRGQEPANKPGKGEAAPFREGVFQLLLGYPSTAPDQSRLLRGEHLIICRGAHIQKARDLFLTLESAATSVRVATSASHILFHVKDDHGRGSLFQGVAASGELEGNRLLNAFELENQYLFMEPSMDPDPTALKHFGRIIKAAPALFGLRSERIQTPMLAAFVKEDTGGISFLDLTGLGFLSDFVFTENKAANIQFQVQNLKRDEAVLKELWTAIHNTSPPPGYRLGLRETRHLEKGARERQQLEERLADVRYKLAYLDSVSQPRPILLKFEATQLAALADVLRAFPMDILRDDRLLYGFHACEAHPAGTHYLFIDPDKAVMSELDPLALWREPEQTMRFELDPFWARHYHQRETKSLVFTPQGAALTPTLHHWDPKSMDGYLRRVMEHWFRDQPQAAQIPAEPMYLFDGPVGSQQLELRVLDKAGFQPLRLRLAWLSDNLILHKTIGVETLIRKMADAQTQTALVEQVLERKDEAVRHFEETALKTSEAVAQTTNTMTRALTDRLNRTMDRTYVLIGKIKELDKELEQWKLVEKEMRGMVSEVKQVKASITHATNQTLNREAETEERIRRQLAVSQKKREQILEEVGREIKALQNARTTARKNLLDLKIWGKG